MKRLLAALRKLVKQSQKGFTLIELLIVIAVLGVLAGVVLVAIDPTEQLAKANDSGNFNKVGTIANAWQSYLTSQNLTTYPAASATWQTTLVNAGELSTTVTGNSTVACSGQATYIQGDTCYYASGSNAMVWITMNSKANKTKAATGLSPQTCAAGTVAAYVWVSSLSKAGLACVGTGAGPSFPSQVY